METVLNSVANDASKSSLNDAVRIAFPGASNGNPNGGPNGATVGATNDLNNRTSADAMSTSTDSDHQWRKPFSGLQKWPAGQTAWSVATDSSDERLERDAPKPKSPSKRLSKDQAKKQPSRISDRLRSKSRTRGGRVV